MKKNMKNQNETGKFYIAGDICIAAGLAFLGLLIALNNAVFNFVYSGGQRKVKTTYFVKLVNKFANCCALSFNRLESKLSFNRERA